jgi:regulator of replication initiation timing
MSIEKYKSNRDDMLEEIATLKKENERFKKKLNFMVDTADRLHGENTELRECLSWYADHSKWHGPLWDRSMDINEHGYQRAQECLEEAGHE